MISKRPDFRALGERIAHEQDAILAREKSRATFRGVPRKTAPRPALWLAAASFVALVGASAVYARTRPLTLTVNGAPDTHEGWVAAPDATTVPIRFSDGTEVALAPNSHARVLDVTRSGAHVMLESGHAHVSVTPNRGGKWTFSAGPYNVEVKGTRFDLAWSQADQVFSLDLLEGSVIVSGCSAGEPRQMFAGDVVHASCPTNALAITRASLSPPPPPASAEPAIAPAMRSDHPPDVSSSAPDPLPAPRASGHAQPPAGESWQALARASKFEKAFARVNERGFDVELARASRDDLLLLGDVARLSGDATRALVAYRRVRTRAPGTDAAASAAFSIGRVAFDRNQAYGDAAKGFATYLRERPEGAFAREALGRQMEALSRAGDSVGAARVADAYIAKYPTGPHAPLARSLRSEAN